MAENENGAAAPQIRMNVASQFVRDMSFENILARTPDAAPGQPDVKVQVGLDAKKLGDDNRFEVVMRVETRANAAGSENALFLLEIEYVGIFNIEGVPEDQMHPFLLIECPRMLFPFVRRIVSDVTRDGGFPPLNLETIDFVALYRQELQRRAAEGGAAQA
jgi:preprotein translocase subunit SecB